MKWKMKELENTTRLTLPDSVRSNVWQPCQIEGDDWEFQKNDRMQTIFFRRDSESVEIPVRILNFENRPDRDSIEQACSVLYSSRQGFFQTELRSVVDIPGMEQRMAAQASMGTKIKAPMVGKVLKVSVSEGDAVKSGQELFVIEAMKMENKIYAPADGTIEALDIGEGEQTKLGQVIATIQ